MEPNYEYIKGQGWVLSTCQLVSKVIGLWNLKIEVRTPSEGDLWVYWDQTPESFLDAIERVNPISVFNIPDYQPRFGSKARSDVDYTGEKGFVLTITKV